MSKWKRSPTHKGGVVEEDGCPVASCYEVEHAKTIILEHNSHAALLGASKALLGMFPAPGEPCHDLVAEEYKQVADAITLAEPPK